VEAPPDLSALPVTRRALERGLDSGLHLGGQIYVSVAGRPVVDDAFGEVRAGEPMTRRHLMLWLSSGKPITAVAIAQLWERGLLDLDDPVRRYLPEFAAAGKERVTVRHLLTHTGGFRMLEVGWPDSSWEEIVSRICAVKLEPRWVPGETAGYHMSSSWFILGELIRKLDGRSFSDFVRCEIFEPLDLGDCWIGMPLEAFERYGNRIAPMFDVTGTPARPFDWHREERVTRPSPGGNGYGPIRELGRFYEALLAGGARGDARILRPQTVEALTSRHRVGRVDKTFRHVMDWSLGLILNSRHYGVDTVPYAYGPHASDRTYGHSGYRSSTAFADPEHRLVVAVAVNGIPEDEAHAARFEEITGAIYADLELATTS
jgi:CubicO group peptidase (beta-lactamase class C family)